MSEKMSEDFDGRYTMDDAREVLRNRIRARSAERGAKTRWVSVNTGAPVVVETVVSTADVDTVYYRLVGTPRTVRCTAKEFLARFVRSS